MKLTVKPSNKVEDGRHDGVITGIEYRDTPHEYTDLVIEFGQGQKIKAGVPTFLSPTSQLGKLMELFGQKLEVDKVLEPEDVFIGRTCTFMTMTNDKGYANVVKGSVKPR